MENLNRFRKEIEFIKKNLQDTAEFIDIDEKNLSFYFTLKGSKGTIYEYDQYVIIFKRPKHPFKPPKTEFKTLIDFPLCEYECELEIYSIIYSNYSPLVYEFSPFTKLTDLISRIIFFINQVRKTKTPLMEKALGNSLTKDSSNSEKVECLNNGNLLENIKSKYIFQSIFSNLDEKIKLKTIKYNKRFQDKIDINLMNYIFYSEKYIEYETNNKGKEYHFSELIFEGEYLNGERNGKGKEYQLGKLIFEGEFLKGKRNGKEKEYDYDGKLRFEGEYLNGERHGKGKEYDKDGILRFEGEYINGKRLTGKVYDKKGNFYSNLESLNGLIKEIYTYNDNIEFSGLFEDSGNIKFCGEYLNGQRNGKGKEYYSNGKLKFEGEYLNGQRHGKGKEYYDNDKKDESLFVNNRKIKFEGTYNNGKMHSGIGYDLMNHKIYEFNNGKGYKKEYDEKGKLTFEGEYLNGEKNGKGKEYDYNGNYVIFEGEYLNGKRNGKGKEYKFGDELTFEGEYLNGQRHGKAKEYNSKGELIFEGEYLYSYKLRGKHYVHGKLEYEGEYLRYEKWNGKGYDENGNIVYELEYGNGNVKEFDINEQLEFEGKYFKGARFGKGKEYYGHSTRLKFEGYYFNGWRVGKGKEIDFMYGQRKIKKLTFEGFYIEGRKNGYGKEYLDYDLIFEGEYLKGKRWNGKGKGLDSRGELRYECEYLEGEEQNKKNLNKFIY